MWKRKVEPRGMIPSEIVPNYIEKLEDRLIRIEDKLDKMDAKLDKVLEVKGGSLRR